MTQKELLYVEDAIGHEKNIVSILEQSIENIKDENLVSFFKDELKEHNTLKEKLMGLLGEKANE